MTENDRVVGHRLLETGVVVPFRLLEHEILPAQDPAEFGIRLKLKFEPEDEDEDPEDIVEWGAFGFMFALAVLSFADAGPRESSALEYREKDDLAVSDFLSCLSFRRGVLEFRADYMRGRRMKTDIGILSDGSVTLATIGRGKAAFHWLDRIQGKRSKKKSTPRRSRTPPESSANRIPVPQGRERTSHW